MDKIENQEVKYGTVTAAKDTDCIKSYKEMYEEEKRKNEELENQMTDLVNKLSNMSENALTLFNERAEKEDLIKGLRKENTELVQENEFLRKQVEAGIYYKNIADGFVGLARLTGQEIHPEPPHEEVEENVE